MGCDSYEVGRSLGAGNWDTVTLKFSESDDDYTCLCTFPGNYMGSQEALGTDEVRSLAMLGALVVLAHHGNLKEQYNYVPYDVPDWIRAKIDALLPVEPEPSSI